MVNGIEVDGGTLFASARASFNGQEGGIWGLKEYTMINVVSGIK
jgi:hypothetical protein